MEDLSTRMDSLAQDQVRSLGDVASWPLARDASEGGRGLKAGRPVQSLTSCVTAHSLLYLSEPQAPSSVKWVPPT